MAEHSSPFLENMHGQPPSMMEDERSVFLGKMGNLLGPTEDAHPHARLSLLYTGSITCTVMEDPDSFLRAEILQQHRRFFAFWRIVYLHKKQIKLSPLSLNSSLCILRQHSVSN